MMYYLPSAVIHPTLKLANIISICFAVMWITFRRIELVQLGGVHESVSTDKQIAPTLCHMAGGLVLCCGMMWSWYHRSKAGIMLCHVIHTKKADDSVLVFIYFIRKISYMPPKCLFYSTETQKTQSHLYVDDVPLTLSTTGFCLSADTFAVVIRPPCTHSLYRKHWATFINLLS